MKTLIAEDESLAAERLHQLIQKVDPEIEVTGIFDTLEDIRSYLTEDPSVDLLFLDVQLSDGLSFDIFNECSQNKPVIFTTAYEQYSLRAFKVNSIDYLLKPINYEDLQRAINKYKTLNQNPSPYFYGESGLNPFLQPTYKKRFLVKLGDHYYPIQSQNIAYFYSDEGLVYLVDQTGKNRYSVNYTLEELENLLNPENFFRISRKFIVNIDQIHDVRSYYNGRLLLLLNTSQVKEMIVSRERVNSFKEWLDS